MNNPPAFPTLEEHRFNQEQLGMTLRDYFAAKAMQALIDNDTLFSDIAIQAYQLADAMLKEREA